VVASWPALLLGLGAWLVAAMPVSSSANPGPLTFQNVGSPVPAGTSTPATGGFNLTVGGTDIGGMNDQFAFSHAAVTGDFDYKVRVAGLSFVDPWTKAGLMARAELTTNSPFAASLTSPSGSGAYFAFRPGTGVAASSQGNFPVNYPNTWLRLRRTGSTFTGYASFDGENWAVLGSSTNPLPATVFVGLAAASRSNGQATTAEFRNYTAVVGGTIGQVRMEIEPPGPSRRTGPLAITEILHSPAPPYTNETEFIEIYNSNPFAEEVSGYRLTGEVEFTFPEGMEIPGNAYVIVAKNPGVFQSVYGISALGPYSNALASAGSLRLLNKERAVMIDVPYSHRNPWPIGTDQTGHSLVLTRASYGEADPHAWSISAALGGSPGRHDSARAGGRHHVVINEFLAHTDLPQVDFVELYNHGNQPVDLSGCFLSDDATTNKFTFPAGTTIPARGYVTVDQNQLGFGLSSGGEILYFRAPDNLVIDAIDFEAQANGISSGRFPDGSRAIYPLATRSPGAANGPIRVHDIVINELMYKPISGDSDDEYIELFNRGTSPIDIGGWRFTAGVTYTFPSNIVVAPGGYVVVARSVTNLLAKYSALTAGNTFGDYDGSLANRGERVALARPDLNVSTNNAGQPRTNTVYVVVDEVTYNTGGNWPVWANEGGSSLELTDARSNHRLAHNWADSDETAKAPWTEVEFTGPLDHGSENQAVLEGFLLGEGECLLDNVEVFSAAVSGGANVCTNGTFENGLGGWLTRGDHLRSTWSAAGAGFSGGRALHVRSDARGDSIMNRLRTPMAATMPINGIATIRAKMRWLRGWPEFILRTHGNYLESFTRLKLPGNLGTPGARNSRATANNAPAISEVTHNPVLPDLLQPVAVTARVHDPDGVTSFTLRYRIDPSPTQTSVPMVDDGSGLDAVAGDGIFTGTIPGQGTNVIVAFQVTATDALGAARLFPLQTPSYTRPFECLVRFGDPNPASSFGIYRQWMTQDNVSDWQNRPALSNERIFETFVYGNFRVVYNCSAKWSGSPYHQFSGSPVTTAAHYSIELPRDDIFLGTENLNKVHAPGNGPFDDNTTQREQFAYWMARQLGLPYNYRRYVNVFFNGNRRGGTTSIMEDTQTPGSDVIDSLWPDDPDGPLFKIQPWFETDDTTGASVGFRNVAWASLNRFLTVSNGVPIHKTARYRHNYLVRSPDTTANQYDDVFRLVDAANTPTNNWETFNAAMESVADIEQWMRTFAIHHSVGDWDHYGSRNSQNMYGYVPSDGRWRLMIWDMNIVFNNGSSGPGANLFEINTQDDIMPRLFAGRPGPPTIGYSVKFRRMYLRALKEICLGPWQVSKVNAILDAKHRALLASGITPGSPDAIKSFINSGRTTVLNVVTNEEGASFKLTSTNQIATSSNVVLITGEAPIEVAYLRVNGQLVPVTWTRVKSWEIRVVLESPATNLLIEALDRHGKVLPYPALSIPVNYSGSNPPPDGQIVISEIHYHPLTPEASFVEVHNRGTQGFDLSGWRLNGVGFTFPSGTIIAPGQSLAVAENAQGFGTAFPGSPLVGLFEGRLDNGGETLTLEEPMPAYTTNAAIVTTNVVYRAIDKVRFDDDLPWPGDADGIGPSLQLIDAHQDNSRVSNWTDRGVWRQARIIGNMGSSTNNLRVYIYLDGFGGDVLIDDVWLAEGTVAEGGPNLIPNGGFESALSPPWNVSTNNVGTTIVSTQSRSGGSSLRFIGLTFGVPSTNRAVYADVPGANTNTIYTLSYWYFSTTNGTNLTIRTAPGSALTLTANVRPIYATPGAANSSVATLPAYDPVWLNEVLLANLTGATDNNGEREPWIELYNAGDAAVDLTGYALATSYTNNLLEWPFPAGTVVAPKSFKVIWADAQPAQSTASSLHTNFRLGPGAGQLALVRPVNNRPQITDYLNYPALGADVSYGSAPDGQPFNRVILYNSTPGGTNIARNVNVIVNEWMAGNTNGITDPADGEYDDWFELYNAGDTAVDLGGYYLTDNLANGNQFMIPTNGHYVIPPGGFLLVWADNEEEQNSSEQAELHASFQLARGGDSIGLFSPDGQTVIDTVTFGEQTNNVSQGRFADGANTIYFMTTPTPGGPNTIGGTGNTPPTLAPLVNRTIALGQTVTFLAEGTDFDTPAQSLTYSLDAGAPAGAVIGPVSGQFSWTPTAQQAPGTNAITVRVTDSGIPPLSAARVFTVVLRLPPQITIGSPGPGQVALSFDAIVGRTYRVDYKNNLSDETWVPLAAPAPAQGNTVSVQDQLGVNPQRFYRIVQLD
jgi:regulation of enolase protein 1 (concanavalin A-like superfamily)